MRVAIALALALFAALASAPRTPTVYLNHFFVVVDATTYSTLQDSAFVTSDFAPFEKRTTSRNDKTYTGIYWYGRHTYFEVFEPEAQGPVGASGVALGVEGAGESSAVKAAWATALGEADTGLITRKTETGEAPWFEMTSAQTAEGALRVWLMEYHGDFLARFYPDLTPARGISRAEVLDRYVAKIGRSALRERALVKDVVGLELALEPAERDRLSKHLRAVGWSVEEEKDAVALRGPEGVFLRVSAAAPGRRGITEAIFSLQAKAEPRTSRLGSAVLEIEPDRARLRFGAAAPR